jgi:negative regulator of flagellin synthesis FlgM
MTDPITNVGRTAAQSVTNNDGAQLKKANDVMKQVGNQVSSSRASDELVLSKTAESALANAEFDAAKVAQIKAAIEEGNYPIDAKKVAESFASLEKMISGS